VSNEQDEADADTSQLERLSRFVLSRQEVDEEAELSVALVSEAEMRRLNERYTGRKGLTDVLAFPMDEAGEEAEGEPEEPPLLGDVVICPAEAKRNAQEHSSTLGRELSLLLVHGILHLLGYDHCTGDEAETMRRREKELLDAFEPGGQA